MEPVYRLALTLENVFHSIGVLVSIAYLCLCLLKKWCFPSPDNTSNKSTEASRKLLALYNMGIVLSSAFSAWLFVRPLMRAGGFAAIFSHNAGPAPNAMLNAFWFYNLLKYIELMDTLIIVVRGKSNQLSYLHIYHHSSILMAASLAYEFTPWTSIAPMFLMNMMVHIVMYSYWAALAWMGKDVIPFDWKKRITQVQLLQFVIGLVHTLTGLVCYHFCVYSVIYSISFLVLFSRFYYHRYVRRRPQKKLQ